MEVFEASLSGTPVFRIVGDVDHFTAASLEAAARKALSIDGRHLLFDLSAVPYIDSGGAGVFLTLERDMGSVGWLGVIGPSKNLMRIFDIVGLTSRPSFRVFPRVEDATEALEDVVA